MVKYVVKSYKLEFFLGGEENVRGRGFFFSNIWRQRSKLHVISYKRALGMCSSHPIELNYSEGMGTDFRTFRQPFSCTPEGFEKVAK